MIEYLSVGEFRLYYPVGANQTPRVVILKEQNKYFWTVEDVATGVLYDASWIRLSGTVLNEMETLARIASEPA